MSNRFIGVQIGPKSILDEGVDHCLDLLQETACVNALMVYSHTYYFGLGGRPRATLAEDHGVPLKETSAENMRQVWTRTNDDYYAGTILRQRKARPTDQYADRDIFAELAEPLRKRGMKLYARILEASSPALAAVIPNWSKVLTVDIFGRAFHLPCWNNPDYRRWWISSTEDLFKTYPLDGLQWGAERVGPLSRLLYSYGMPTCFCEHCRSAGRNRGVDVERARRGFQSLYEMLTGIANGAPPPSDGIIVSILRTMLKYPEVLAWDRMYYESYRSMAAEIGGVAKVIRPTAEFGMHVDHQQSSWDIIWRAHMEYERMADFCDFIKFIGYHDILGPRLRRWVLDRLAKATLKEVSLEQSLGLFFAVMGYDPASEPKLGELDTKGFSPDYVYRETRRCVEAVKGRCRVYPGIGFDVPWNDRRFEGDPENVHRAVRKAFEAGASGILVSREYDEMRVVNLKAVGRAVREVDGRP